MLTYSSPGTAYCSFAMVVNYRREIVIQFADIFEYLSKDTNLRKLIFIDPIVLANQDEFLGIEQKNPKIILVPTNINESTKDIDSLTSVLSVMESNGLGRRGDIVCAVGGGALLDTVSFAASIFRRGISIVKVPTTLLGIVDASIGIKTGINYLDQRNRLGSYHFDYSVIADPKLMKGLHKGLVRQGLGEIFKIAVIKSETLFALLSDNLNHLEDVQFYSKSTGREVLELSIRLMLEELHDNPREDNLMRCVDYGHSFSPLVEMESLKRHSFKSLPHGYAVAYDCVLTAAIANHRGLLNENDYEAILGLFTSVDFNLTNELYTDLNLLWASFVEMTKHRGGSQNLPVPVGLGSHTFIQDVTFEELQHCASHLNAILNEIHSVKLLSVAKYY
jgi:3-dehydroquinate synthetase